MYKLLLLLFITSCAHSSLQEKFDEHYKAAKKDLKKLENQINYLSYEQENIRCFTVRDICNLIAVNYCSSSVISKSDTCLKKTKKICWKKHEKCIITNYKRWKKAK